MGAGIDVVTSLQARLVKVADEVHARMLLVADDIGGAASLVSHDNTQLADELAAVKAELAAAVTARAAAERHREMFRHALWLYLQERDGAAGAGAPTPETLKMIRELIGSLDGVA